VFPAISIPSWVAMHEFVTLFKNACDFLYVDFFFILAFSPQTKIAVDNDFPPVKTFVSC